MNVIINHTNLHVHGLPVAESDSPLPSHHIVQEIVQICRRSFFQGFYGAPSDDAERLDQLLHRQLALVLPPKRVDEVYDKFIETLESLGDVLRKDVEATYKGDPAATGYDEVVLCYPGIYAVTNYRVAHCLHILEVPLIPRMISEQAHSVTGIDIHPAATIGPGLMIDHGTGLVVGATCIIGSNVKLYQGVTLGARSFEMDDNGDPVKGVARHPIVGNNVIIYANATVLGRVTVGDGAVIGGNVWVTRDVAPGEKIVQAQPEKLIRSIT